jgi:hypothetical protein
MADLIKIHKADDRGNPIEESLTDLKVFIADPYFIHYLGMLSPPRPGVLDCVQLLEYTYFPPWTERNALFHARVIEWQDIMWSMISIPIGDREMMDKSAMANRLRVANGVPIVFSGGEMYSFPAGNERVFTLENIKGHPVYKQGIHHNDNAGT